MLRHKGISEILVLYFKALLAIFRFHQNFLMKLKIGEKKCFFPVDFDAF